jgi:hypothetical protein
MSLDNSRGEIPEKPLGLDQIEELQSLDPLTLLQHSLRNLALSRSPILFLKALDQCSNLSLQLLRQLAQDSRSLH